MYRTNNIYDLAGNVNEWTQEVCYSKYYANRGGKYYNDTGTTNPVISRSFNESSPASNYMGAMRHTSNFNLEPVISNVLKEMLHFDHIISRGKNIEL